MNIQRKKQTFYFFILFNFQLISMRGRKNGNGKRKEKDIYNNRINIVLAIVFLLSACMIYKLYDLQVQKYDLYSAMASGQHQVSTKLNPERGNIYIKNQMKSKKGQEDVATWKESDLYSLATNKDYALIYAIPKEIEDIITRKEYAEKLYRVFDKERIKKEVKEYFEKQDRKALQEKWNNIPDDLSPEETKKKKLALQEKKELVQLREETFRVNQQRSVRQMKGEAEKFLEMMRHDDKIVRLRESIAEKSKKRLRNGTITAADYVSDLDAEVDARIKRKIHHLQYLKSMAMKRLEGASQP